MLRAIISLFLLGVSFGAGPCLATCGPLLLAYLAGANKSAWRSLVAYFVFSSVRIAVYVLLGILVYLLGKFVTERIFTGLARYIYILGGGFVFCIGMLMALGKHIDAAGCRFLQRHLLDKDRKSIFIFGLLVGLLPCAPLLALFSYVGLISKSWFLSAVYAFSFGLGTLLSPLLILAVLAGAAPRLLLRLKPGFSRILNFACGAILMFLGIQLIRRGFYV